MPATHFPTTEAEVAAIVLDARVGKTPLAISGGNTRAGFGRAMQTAADLSLGKLTGITLYEPSEMVISARSGTPVEEIRDLLASKNQILPFEPMDHRPLYGTTGEPTIGGLVATNASGPRRIAVGAARDHLIGVRFVNGYGEAIKSGGRVMKNVTGLDMVKLLCGSHGTLGVLTEVTFKVLPRPESSATLVIAGLSDVEALATLCRALGSPFDANAAAHLPAGLAGGAAQTLLRVEGFGPSVEYRLEKLKELLAQPSAKIENNPARWSAIRDCLPLTEPRNRDIWRLSLTPTSAPRAVAALAARVDIRHFYDWGGGLVWLSVPAGTSALAIRTGLKGHATKMRGSPETEPFHPLSAPLHRLNAHIRRSFDPDGLFNPGRMYGGE